MKTFAASEAESFVSRLPLPAGARVLDIACGTGAATLPLARRGVTTTGLDMVPKHLAEAEAAAEREGLSIRFDEGFAEDLPYPDRAFDVVISMFGAMFSQEPDRVVAEMARVLKPGGLLAMANWTPSGFSGLMSEIPKAFLPPSPAAISPMLWGEEATARRRLNGHFSSVACRSVEVEWRSQMSAADSATFFMANAGPFQALLSRLDESACSLLRADMKKLWVDKNIASESDRTIIKNEYLEVTALRGSSEKG